MENEKRRKRICTQSVADLIIKMKLTDETFVKVESNENKMISGSVTANNKGGGEGKHSRNPENYLKKSRIWVMIRKKFVKMRRNFENFEKLREMRINWDGN